MKIISNDSMLLDEIYNDLKIKRIEAKKGVKNIDGAMGDITAYLSLGSLLVKSLDTLLNYLKFRHTQKNNYLHFKLKDGAEVKLDNLPEEMLNEILGAITKDISKLDYISIGYRK